MESIARSAARVPCAIRSSARWKSNQPISPTRGEISKSGGSPARRARVMRSCMMLKASTMTEEMPGRPALPKNSRFMVRSEEHTSELQSRSDLVCRLLLEKKKIKKNKKILKTIKQNIKKQKTNTKNN